MIMGINKYIITHFGKLLSFQRGGKSAPDCVVLPQLLMPLRRVLKTQFITSSRCSKGTKDEPMEVPLQ